MLVTMRLLGVMISSLGLASKPAEDFLWLLDSPACAESDAKYELAADMFLLMMGRDRSRSPEQSGGWLTGAAEGTDQPTLPTRSTQHRRRQR